MTIKCSLTILLYLPFMALCDITGVLRPAPVSSPWRRHSAEELKSSRVFRFERVGGSMGGLLGLAS